MEHFEIEALREKFKEEKRVQLAEAIFEFIHSHEDIMMNGGKFNNLLTIKEWVDQNYENIKL